MRAIAFVALFMSASPGFATGYLRDFNYQLTDIASRGIRKETLFSSMVREFIDLDKSICSNRAHLWAYDMYRFNGHFNTGKIFIFFGSSVWKKEDKKTYMYHVAPYIVENGTEYVMEASYPEVTKPMTVEEWIENETYNRVKGSECLEITAEDTDLTEYFYERKILPERRQNGKQGARCYIRKVPGYYWFPASIAYHDLKKDDEGKPVTHNPTNFDKEEVMEACIEAASTKVGRIFGGGKAKCKSHLK